jgi:hypothetical protein
MRRFGTPPTGSPSADSAVAEIVYGGMLIPIQPRDPPQVGPIPAHDPAHMAHGDGSTSDPNSKTSFLGAIGILGTPVIDRARGAMYLVARTKEGAEYVQTLHALDIVTGKEKPNRPVVIARAAWHPRIGFAIHENQRPGLALANDQVVIAWGSPGGLES